MESRTPWLFVILLATTVVGSVAYWYSQQLGAAKHREQLVRDLGRIGEELGPCAGLAQARAISVPLTEELKITVEGQRRALVTQILGSDDRRAQSAFLSADREGLIDRGLCEQIKLVHDLGEMHPVLALLRFTREGSDPCDASYGFDEVLDGLTSHRTLMLKALMRDPGKLTCLASDKLDRLGSAVLELVRETPTILDDLETLKIASFLASAVPFGAAELACYLEAKSQASKLGQELGCTADHKSRVLAHYSYPHRLAGPEGSVPVPADAELLILHREGERCEVRPVAEPPRLFKVACADLKLVSELELAVLVEQIGFGVVRADLIAGVARYLAADNKLTPPGKEPTLSSWFAYNRAGEPLGATQVVTLKDLGEQYNEEVPDAPLRAFCKNAGARYCYDVDWAQVVTKLAGEPVLFLSRPLPVFLREPSQAPELKASVVKEALGREPEAEVTSRVLELTGGGYVVVADGRGSVELAWRLASEGAWTKQSFGAVEGGKAAPSARLLAVLDLQQDGKPELVMQRANRGIRQGQVKDENDQVVLLGLDAKGARFAALNQLTVHEY